MSISIVILRYGNELVLHLGNWESVKEARGLTDGDGGMVILLEKFNKEYGTHFKVLEALAESAACDDSMGSEIEKLLRFVFQLGIKTGPTLPECEVDTERRRPIDD